MGESNAATSQVPIDILPGEEIITITTTQIGCDLDVPLSEVQPQRIAMNPKLLHAARSGDKNILDKLLQSENITSRASDERIAIVVPENAATQNDTRCLLGVTLEGNTTLYIAASQGHLKLAEEVCRRERSLLMALNTRLDTPLHCAARAGDENMVSLIIREAKKDEIELRVLMARNWNEANALHEAAKYDCVHVAKVLIEEDAELASMLNDAGMSPLYLAIVTGSLNVAKALLHSSSWKKNSLAYYLGSSKQTALHAATYISQEITRDLLDQKPVLAKSVDSSGRIPLHYAALGGHRDTAKLLLERDPSTAYISDADGFFPIHIAAMTGNIPIVDQILKQCPEAFELLDKRGRNFLHVAFEGRKLDVVKKIISKRPDLRKLLNDQDNEGNTPLHTAVENRDQHSVHFLLRDKTVLINVINHDDFTPLDLAHAKLDKGLHFSANVASCILSSLAFIKALPSPSLHAFKEVVSSHVGEGKEEIMKGRQRDEEMKKWEDVPKNSGIATALIITVTFAAGFNVPRGYITDNHPDHGTAFLTKEYAFKVFLVSNAFAFVCSFLATFWYIRAGLSTIDQYTRWRHLSSAEKCLWVAFSGMSTAFAMGVYAIIGPGYESINIFLCTLALGTPVLAMVLSQYNLYHFGKTIGIRQGARHWIWPTTIYPHVENILGFGLVPRRAIIQTLLPILGSYAVFFLFAKLLASIN